MTFSTKKQINTMVFPDIYRIDLAFFTLVLRNTASDTTNNKPPDQNIE